ncbi:8458_t:CDS:2, partial [Racocetra persica]
YVTRIRKFSWVELSKKESSTVDELEKWTNSNADYDEGRNFIRTCGIVSFSGAVNIRKANLAKIHSIT